MICATMLSSPSQHSWRSAGSQGTEVRLRLPGATRSPGIAKFTKPVHTYVRSVIRLSPGKARSGSEPPHPVPVRPGRRSRRVPGNAGHSIGWGSAEKSKEECSFRQCLLVGAILVHCDQDPESSQFCRLQQAAIFQPGKFGEAVGWQS